MTPKKIRNLRKMLGLSQVNMASKIGIGRRTLQEKELAESEIDKSTWMAMGLLHIEKIIAEDYPHLRKLLLDCARYSR